jgi:hypothetical protein
MSDGALHGLRQSAADRVREIKWRRAEGGVTDADIDFLLTLVEESVQLNTVWVQELARVVAERRAWRSGDLTNDPELRAALARRQPEAADRV